MSTSVNIKDNPIKKLVIFNHYKECLLQSYRSHEKETRERERDSIVIFSRGKIVENQQVLINLYKYWYIIYLLYKILCLEAHFGFIIYIVLKHKHIYVPYKKGRGD